LYSIENSYGLINAKLDAGFTDSSPDGRFGKTTEGVGWRKRRRRCNGCYSWWRTPPNVSGGQGKDRCGGAREMGASKSTRRRCESSKEKGKTQRRNYRSRSEKTFTANESALGGQKKSK